MTRFGRTDVDLYLFVDTETSGLLPRGRLVQLAASLTTASQEELALINMIVKPVGFTIPKVAEDIHGISTAQADEKGIPVQFVLKMFNFFVFAADVLIAHNVKFDSGIIANEYEHAGMIKDRERFLNIPKKFCTMQESTAYCRIPKARGAGLKWPKLGELYQIVTGRLPEDSHGALADVSTVKEVFFPLKEEGVFEV